ncbi:ubinuclein-1 isoform X1 [Hydra vulgaris]|uniref:ubinuclein-1 isoform X1 n=1 Tax=Hydra vulgaris TaxID=6087 RepID=UPI001F5FAAC8|nr:ubinuclein-1 [Hydra vulgaris]XP_047125749.1 ubinuclein-1 [Hydra vulgaris]
MSDGKRITLSVSFEKPKLGNPDNNKTQNELVHRYNLNLFPSNDASFPEFDYSLLLKSEQKVNSTADSSLDNFEEDSTLKALAKKLEQKYGSASLNEKKKASKHLDTFDIGYGYDESDSFLDNSEAYDEVVPSDWTTEHGGFYINEGNLDFKPVSQSANDKILQKVFASGKKRKRIIPKELNTEKKKKQFLNKEKQRKKLEALNKAQKILFKKKHKKNSSVVHDETSQDGGLNKSLEDDLPLSKIKESVNGSSDKKIVPENDKKQDVIITSTVQTSSITFQHKSLVNTLVNNSLITTAITNMSNKQKTENESLKNSPVKVESPLPSGLNENLLFFIKQLCSFASIHNKGSFFTPEVNQTLLKFARECKVLSPRLRNGVYEHVSFYLPCAKDTLRKRCQRLIVKDQQDLEDVPLKLLKEAIEKNMVEQKKNYEDQVDETIQEQAREQIKHTGLDPIKSNESQDVDAKVKKYTPKKKFVWHDDIRKLLCDVVQVKVNKFSKSNKSMSAEEYIKDFLESEIRKLWPKGWMTSRVLYKECRATHNAITQPLKVKKFKTDSTKECSVVSSVSLSEKSSITLNGSPLSTTTLNDSGIKNPVVHNSISKPISNDLTLLNVSSQCKQVAPVTSRIMTTNSLTLISNSPPSRQIISVTTDNKCSISSLKLVDVSSSESKLVINSNFSPSSHTNSLLKQSMQHSVGSRDSHQASPLNKSHIAVIERSKNTIYTQSSLSSTDSSQISKNNICKSNQTYTHVPEYNYSHNISFSSNLNQSKTLQPKNSKVTLTSPMVNFTYNTTENRICIPTLGKASNQFIYAQNNLNQPKFRSTVGTTVSNNISESWRKDSSCLSRLPFDANHNAKYLKDKDSITSNNLSKHDWNHPNKFRTSTSTVPVYPRRVDTIVITDDEINRNVLSSEIYNIQSKNSERTSNSHLLSQHLVKTSLIAKSPNLNLFESTSSSRALAPQQVIDNLTSPQKSIDIFTKNNGASNVGQHFSSLEHPRSLQKIQDAQIVVSATSSNSPYQQHNSDHILHYPLKFNQLSSHQGTELGSNKNNHSYCQPANLFSSQLINDHNQKINSSEEVEMIRKEFLGSSAGNISFDSKYR